jgi:hypothetical protein
MTEAVAVSEIDFRVLNRLGELISELREVPSEGERL